MRVRHLNCMSFRIGVPDITHCLLLEARDGLVLVDSGLGTKDYTHPSATMRIFMAVNRVPRDVEETAVRQVVGLGFAPEDVRHIVLTHLHLDHNGGLPDFPWAKVHVYASEYEAAMHPRPFSLFPHICDPTHWAHGPDWAVHSLRGERWFGLDCVRVIDDGVAEVLLVPLVGHSRGMCGVAVKTPDGWLLHCGDAYVRQMQVDPHHPRSPFPRWAGFLERAAFPPEPLRRLRALLRDHGDEVTAFPAHDRAAFERLRDLGD